MIDIHCHILPGIDDGPIDIETSIEMLKTASNDGISHIVATPHFIYNDKPSIKDIKDLVILLEERINLKHIAVKLLSGADIRLTYELIYGIEKNEIMTINSSRYFLLELPPLLPPNLDTFFLSIEKRGFIPIITHPERNYKFFSSIDKLKSLKDAGALIQITAMSITGEFGNQIKSFSRMLLRKGMVDFIASDAHNTAHRPPLLSRAYKETANFLNKKEAKKLFFENPLAVIENKEIQR